MRDLNKRIDHLKARLCPDDDRRLDALVYRAVATFGVSEDERRLLLEHADAIEAARASRDPPLLIGAMKGIMDGPMQ